VTALLSAIARAMPFVPLAKAGFSNHPTGPFQITVPAFWIRSANWATAFGPMSTPIREPMEASPTFSVSLDDAASILSVTT